MCTASIAGPDIEETRQAGVLGCVSAPFWPRVVRAEPKSNSSVPKGAVVALVLSSFGHALNCLLPTTPTTPTRSLSLCTLHHAMTLFST
jgi:hypothetical protein